MCSAGILNASEQEGRGDVGSPEEPIRRAHPAAGEGRHARSVADIIGHDRARSVMHTCVLPDAQPAVHRSSCESGASDRRCRRAFCVGDGASIMPVLSPHDHGIGTSKPRAQGQGLWGPPGSQVEWEVHSSPGRGGHKVFRLFGTRGSGCTAQSFTRAGENPGVGWVAAGAVRSLPVPHARVWLSTARLLVRRGADTSMAITVPVRASGQLAACVGQVLSRVVDRIPFRDCFKSSRDH